MDVDVFKQRFLPFHPKLYRIAYALLDNKASPNATFRVTKHDLLRRNQWLNTYFHPLSIPS